MLKRRLKTAQKGGNQVDSVSGSCTEHFKLMTEETWPDFEELFSRHKGVRGGCWCTFHQCSSSAFQRMTREERKDFHRNRVLSGITTGVIYYYGEIPVAWCQFGRPEIFEQINRDRAYLRLDIQAGERPDWRICCVFVSKDYRHQGLSKKVLSAALMLIKELGGGTVEAFPLDIPGNIKPQYTGSVKMYLDEGFEMAGRMGKNVQLMRRTV